MEKEQLLLEKLKASDLSLKTNKKHYIYIQNNYISKIQNKTFKNHIQEIEHITNTKEKVSCLKAVQLELKDNFIKELDDYISIIKNFGNMRDKIKALYSLIVEEILKKEELINSFLTYYSEFKMMNKTNIIRNDILNNFLKKISFSNKEKEVLLVKKTAEKTFFDLLKRILLLSDNVKLISDNSNEFSKNLLISLKENISIIKELANEKIIYYVKNVFQEAKNHQSTSLALSSKNSKSSGNSESALSVSQNLLKKEIINYEVMDNIIISLKFINENTNYVVYIQKEYINFRKKAIEDSYKYKKIKFNMGSVDFFVKMFLTIMKQFEFLFLRESILMFSFFYDSDIFYKSELDSIISYLNIDMDDKIIQIENIDYESKLKEIREIKEIDRRKKSNNEEDNIKDNDDSQTTRTKETNNIESLNKNSITAFSSIDIKYNFDKNDKHNYLKCEEIFSNFLTQEANTLYNLANKVNKNYINPENKSNTIFKNFIVGLNTVFYHFLYEIYETLHLIKNNLEETEKNFSTTYKYSLILRLIQNRLDIMFSNLKLDSHDYKNFEIFSLINNYLHKFNKSFIKISNEISKSITRLKQSCLKELNQSTKSSELSYINQLIQIAMEVVKILEIKLLFNSTFKLNQEIYNDSNKEFSKEEELEKNGLNSILFSIIEFFADFSVKKLLKDKYVYNNTDQVIAIKIFDFYNQLKNILKPLNYIVSEIYLQLEEKIDRDVLVIEEFIVKNIISMSNFEENLVKIISQDHAFLFMEKLSDTCNYLIITFLDYLSEFELKEKLKERIKTSLIIKFREIMIKNQECIYILGEEDFKSFLIN